MLLPYVFRLPLHNACWLAENTSHSTYEQVRLRVAIKARYLKHALVCLEALALGCDRPEVVVRLPEFRDTLKDQDAKDDIGESVSSWWSL